MIGARGFNVFSRKAATFLGSPIAFFAATALVIGWAATGKYFGYSDQWSLFINTTTTIITFLMVFLIQNTQNRDGAAIQAKLDELIRSSNARNELMGIEKLDTPL